MCNTQRYSESGKPCGVQRCEEYILIQSDRDRLAGVVLGMEEQSKRNLEALRRAEAENARLRGILESIEWDGDMKLDEWTNSMSHTCPVCKCTTSEGHDKFCKIGNALKEVG